MKAGIKIFEYKPYPEIVKELFTRAGYENKKIPVFAIHAKTMVIDGKTVFIGTFNLDPRSANLNTEVGVIVKNKEIAATVEANILNDAKAENSWEAAKINAKCRSRLIKANCVDIHTHAAHAGDTLVNRDIKICNNCARTLTS